MLTWSFEVWTKSTAAKTQGIVSPMKVMLIHLFFSKFIFYRALHFFTKKKINRRNFFLIGILISKFITWIFWSWGVFFKFWKKRSYFPVIKNFQRAVQVVLTQPELFSSYCGLVLLLRRCSVLAAVYWGWLWHRARLEHLADLPSWMRVHGIADTPRPWEEGINVAFQVLGSGWDAWAEENVSGSPYPGREGTNQHPRWTPNLVAELPGLSPASVTPTQAAIAVIKSSRRCH